MLLCSIKMKQILAHRVVDALNTTVGDLGVSLHTYMHTHEPVLSPWEGRRGEEAGRQSGRDKEKRRK